MIKCTIDKEIKGINFKIIYITQGYNLYSKFSDTNRDFFYVIVNLENHSVLKENRVFNDFPELNVKNLMHDYYGKQNNQTNEYNVSSGIEETTLC